MKISIKEFKGREGIANENSGSGPGNKGDGRAVSRKSKAELEANQNACILGVLQ